MRARQGRRVTGSSVAVGQLIAPLSEPDSDEIMLSEKRIQILDACRSSPLLLDAERLSSGAGPSGRSPAANCYGASSVAHEEYALNTCTTD